MKIYRVRRWMELNYFPATKLGSGDYKDLISGKVIPREDLAETYCLGEESSLSDEDWEFHFGEGGDEIG